MVRKAMCKLPAVCSIGIIAAIATVMMIQPQPISKSKVDSSSARALAHFGKLPLYFIENQGQVDRRVNYYLKGKDRSVYFTSDGVVFALSRDGKRGPESPYRLASLKPPEPHERSMVKLDFIGANPHAEPVGIERKDSVVNYFKGRQEDWKIGLSTYTAVAYEDLWPGIDLEYRGTNGRLKYTFTVTPGADPSQVRLAYRGASAVRLHEQGRLEIETPVGGFAEDRPYVYQEINGLRVEVDSAFQLEDGVYGFRLGKYDHSRPLVLDPVVLVYAGYIGGLAAEFGDDIAVDKAGNAYIAGWAAADDDWSGNGWEEEESDAFVAKVNAAGTALVYLTYIGGSRFDRAWGVAVDADGNAYLAGETLSTEASFPVKVGPDMTYNGGSWAGDGFVAKVNPTGGLEYCGYIGGSDVDAASRVAVDASGNAYVVGTTFSDQTSFPVKVGPDLTYGGYHDAFVAKVTADGTGLTYAGYIGGSGGDGAYGVAVDSAGNAFVGGSTFSSEATFPVTIGPDTTHNGDWDAFVAKVNASGTALDYAGYIGGSGFDNANGLAVDAYGQAYVTGETYSSEATFPAIVGPDTTHNGGYDAFVAKVNVSGTALDYAGYIGGTGLSEGGYGIAVDGEGNAYLTGFTNSSETSFPVKEGPDLTYNGPLHDAFVAKVNPNGTGLIYAGYIGGGDTDVGHGIAVDGDGNAYVTGFTASSQTTFRVKSGPDLSYNAGKNDAFVAKISETAVTVVRPNGGEKLFTGSSFRVDWTASSRSPLSSFDVEFSSDGGVNFAKVPGCIGLAGTARSCTWTAPGPLTTAGRIQVIGRTSGGGSGSDISDADFSIVSGTPKMKLTAPNTPVNWAIGSTRQITWTSNLGPAAFVTVDLSRNGGTSWTQISSPIPNTDIFNWVVTGPETAAARIRVKWANGLAYDISNVDFTIAQPFLALTSPNTATMKWGIGTRQSVTWNSNLGPAENVRLTLSTNGGATFPITLLDSTPNDKSEVVTVPNNPTALARVLVEWITTPAVRDLSNANFQIAAPFVAVTKPNGGEVWVQGTNRTFLWTSNLGAKELVKIELSTDGGTTWTSMAEAVEAAPDPESVLIGSTPSDGSQVIRLPLVTSTKCRARITWLDNPAVSDTSNANFTIKAP